MYSTCREHFCKSYLLICWPKCDIKLTLLLAADQLTSHIDEDICCCYLLHFKSQLLLFVLNMYITQGLCVGLSMALLCKQDTLKPYKYLCYGQRNNLVIYLKDKFHIKLCISVALAIIAVDCVMLCKFLVLDTSTPQQWTTYWYNSNVELTFSLWYLLSYCPSGELLLCYHQCLCV